jgi:hypothetical protein
MQLNNETIFIYKYPFDKRLMYNIRIINKRPIFWSNYYILSFEYSKDDESYISTQRNIKCKYIEKNSKKSRNEMMYSSDNFDVYNIILKKKKFVDYVHKYIMK